MSRDRPAWRSVALPAEHGSWSLVLEPLALGLAAAFSAAGVLQTSSPSPAPCPSTPRRLSAAR